MAEASRITRPRLLLAAIILLLTPLILWQTWSLARYYSLSSLHSRNQHTLKLIAANLSGELTRFRDLPFLLATVNRDIQAYLLSDQSVLENRKINLLLESINKRAGSSDIYIMSTDGLTLAASNWASSRTFIGRNFYYRPYFKQAMAGTSGQYFALGTTSGQRGYYFSYPVKNEGMIIGVVVVKIKLEFFEKRWRSPHHEFIVQDHDGVIFLSTKHEWLYHTLTQLPRTDIQRIRHSRKYSNHSITPLNAHIENSIPLSADLVTIKAAFTGNTSGEAGKDTNLEYLRQSKVMVEAGWRISILAKTGIAGRVQSFSVAIAIIIILSLILLAAFVLERQMRIQQGIQIQEEERKLLEKRVQERTSDLDESNRMLRKEVSERELAEAELLKTQKELIQAGRLAAIGKLSAGISHELSQPLTALRTYVGNARAFLTRDNKEEATSNLTSIAELVDRMGRIVKNLRTFAAQDTKNLRPTYLSPALAEALDLLRQRLDEIGVSIIQDNTDQQIQVVAGSLRLQQIFINLISNAMDALEKSDNKEIHLNIRTDDTNVFISIRDTGVGLNDEDLAHIFDPFYTTKEVGEGLGLGLSITYGIVKQFGGAIYAENHPGGGAVFHIRLKKATL